MKVQGLSAVGPAAQRAVWEGLWVRRAGASASIVVLLLLPWILDASGRTRLLPSGAYTLRIADMILIWSMLTVGQNLITGFCGQLAMGHAAFYGIGAYTSALLVMKLGVPYPAALAAAACAAALLGIIVGFPAMRISGDYLFIVTIGFGEIVRLIFLNWQGVTNGPLGIPGVPPPDFFGYKIMDNTQFFYFSLALLALVVWATYRIVNSDIGRSFQAIREDETAALAMGVNITYYKVLAFTIGAFFAGIAGSVMSGFVSLVGPQSFTIDESVLIFEMAILGGLGSIPGSILGTAIVITANESIRQLSDYRLYVGGLILLGLMIWRPQGIMGTVRLKVPRLALEQETEPDEIHAPTTNGQT
jgi:branched-chain amino acid transport system permease protein